MNKIKIMKTLHPISRFTAHAFYLLALSSAVSKQTVNTTVQIANTIMVSYIFVTISLLSLMRLGLLVSRFSLPTIQN